MLFVQQLAPAHSAAPDQQSAQVGVTGQLVLQQAAHRAAVAHAAAVAAAARAAAAHAAAERAAAARAARLAAQREAARLAAQREAARQAAAQAAEQSAAQQSAAQQPAAQQPAAQQTSTPRAAPVSKPAERVPSGSAEQIAQQMLAQDGWSGQFGCLYSLWERESGWNMYAENPSSGAYGIPQSLPGSKMASAGSDWATDAATQIRWGLSYIRSVYGSPCGAWSHEESSGWY